MAIQEMHRQRHPQVVPGVGEQRKRVGVPASSSLHDDESQVMARAIARRLPVCPRFHQSEGGRGMSVRVVNRCAPCFQPWRKRAATCSSSSSSIPGARLCAAHDVLQAQAAQLVRDGRFAHPSARLKRPRFARHRESGRSGAHAWIAEGAEEVGKVKCSMFVHYVNYMSACSSIHDYTRILRLSSGLPKKSPQNHRMPVDSPEFLFHNTKCYNNIS